MLSIPIRPGTTITGTLEQFTRLASYLEERAANAPDPARLMRLQLWAGQVVIASYPDLHALAVALANRASTAPVGARYTPCATLMDQWSLRTPAAILPLYAPVGDHNDPAAYARSVTWQVDQWQAP
jgi:hypothetical protein